MYLCLPSGEKVHSFHQIPRKVCDFDNLCDILQLVSPISLLPLLTLLGNTSLLNPPFWGWCDRRGGREKENLGAKYLYCEAQRPVPVWRVSILKDCLILLRKVAVCSRAHFLRILFHLWIWARFPPQSSDSLYSTSIYCALNSEMCPIL